VCAVHDWRRAISYFRVEMNEEQSIIRLRAASKGMHLSYTAKTPRLLNRDGPPYKYTGSAEHASGINPCTIVHVAWSRHICMYTMPECKTMIGQRYTGEGARDESRLRPHPTKAGSCVVSQKSLETTQFHNSLCACDCYSFLEFMPVPPLHPLSSSYPLPYQYPLYGS
jgi:hypothetical protein